MPFSDARNERDRAETGRNSNNHGGGNAGAAADRNRAAMGIGGFGGMSGSRGTLSQQQDRINMDAARRAGNAAPGVGAHGNRGTLSQQQDRINTNRAKARSNTAPGVGNYSRAMDDYNNIGQGFFDDPFGAIGRFIGSGFGVGEIDPSTQAPKSFLGRDEASWGIDPIGAALGLGGLALGPAGTLISGLYNRGIKGLTGWQGPMMAFDGNQPVGSGSSPVSGNQGAISTASGVGGFGGQGGGTGNGQFGGYAPLQTPRPKPVQAPTPVTSPGMTQQTVAPAMLGGPIPGLQDYTVNLPSYSYFGLPPAQQRPGMARGGRRAAMFGGY